MADDTPRPGGPRGPRVVVRVSPEMQFLLTRLAAHLLCNKRDLHDEIWRAGLQAHLGVTPEQVEAAQVSTLPRSTAADDPKKLAKMMLR